MKNIVRSKFGLKAVLLPVLLWTAGASAGETATEEMTFDVASDVRVSLENINGSIVIEGSNTSQVHVVAVKKAKKAEYLEGIKIDVDASEDHVHIDTELPKSSGGWFSSDDGGGSVHYTLTVPMDAVLDTISSVNGNIEISGVVGTVSAETVNGTISVTDLEGNGSFETVNGGIEAEFNSFGEGQSINAEAVNGRISITLPADASAKVAAESLNGSIDASDFGLKAEKGFVGRDLAGQIGSGAGRISADTVNGSIKIRKQ